ncbi:MAG: hypothetical protein ACXVXW_12805 [Mycobacteriaceae bacterium]
MTRCAPTASRKRIPFERRKPSTGSAAGMLEAERQFRKTIGYRHLAKLAIAIERDLTHHSSSTSTTKPPPDEPSTLDGDYFRGR